MVKASIKEHRLAAYAHSAWSGWMEYLFEKSQLNDDGTVTIPRWAVERWKRQAKTSYRNLPDEEKLSDLKEANRIIAILNDGKTYCYCNTVDDICCCFDDNGYS